MLLDCFSFARRKTKKDYPYDYYVSYKHTKGYGSIGINSKTDTINLEWISKLKKYIEKKHTAEDVVIDFIQECGD